MTAHRGQLVAAAALLALTLTPAVGSTGAWFTAKATTSASASAAALTPLESLSAKRSDGSTKLVWSAAPYNTRIVYTVIRSESSDFSDPTTVYSGTELTTTDSGGFEKSLAAVETEAGPRQASAPVISYLLVDPAPLVADSKPAAAETIDSPSAVQPEADTSALPAGAAAVVLPSDPAGPTASLVPIVAAITPEAPATTLQLPSVSISINEEADKPASAARAPSATQVRECPVDSTENADGTCSLVSSTVYFYSVSYSVLSWTSPSIRAD